MVSGFLGSGKTTLVRRLLNDAQARGERVAVVSNEFGELGIDEALLGQGEEAYVELAGGCVCCKLSDELSETLQMLWDKVRPDRVVIETSGVAMPFETQLALWRPPVDAWVEDDAAVVVVNADQLAEGRDLSGTWEHQVGSADLLVLNKIDLVDGIEALKQKLAAFNPGTPILEATHGDVPLELLFPRVGRERPDREHPHDHHHDHDHSHEHFHEAFRSFEVQVEDGRPAAEVEAELKQHQALRIKGFVRCAEGLRLVQGVGRRMELSPPPAEPPAALIGRVVVITR